MLKWKEFPVYVNLHMPDGVVFRYVNEAQVPDVDEICGPDALAVDIPMAITLTVDGRAIPTPMAPAVAAMETEQGERQYGHGVRGINDTEPSILVLVSELATCAMYREFCDVHKAGEIWRDIKERVEAAGGGELVATPLEYEGPMTSAVTSEAVRAAAAELVEWIGYVDGMEGLKPEGDFINVLLSALQQPPGAWQQRYKWLAEVVNNMTAAAIDEDNEIAHEFICRHCSEEGICDADAEIRACGEVLLAAALRAVPEAPPAQAEGDDTKADIPEEVWNRITGSDEDGAPGTLDAEAGGDGALLEERDLYRTALMHAGGYIWQVCSRCLSCNDDEPFDEDLSGEQNWFIKFLRDAMTDEREWVNLYLDDRLLAKARALRAGSEGHDGTDT